MPCEAIRNGSSIRGLMATCRNRSTHPPSPRSLTAFLLKVVRPPTRIRPMTANLRRKQERQVQPAALPRSTALRFYLGFHFLHVCYKLANRLLTLYTHIRELDALARLV